MALDRKQKAFRHFPVMPIDANNVNFEQAVVRLLVLLHTKGKPIVSTSKNYLYPENLVELIKTNSNYFEGVDGKTKERLVKNWISSDFATIIAKGRDRSEKPRISNFKPIHLSTIKMLDPRVRSQDRDASLFLYNMFKGTDITSDNDFLMSYLIEGTKKQGEFNLIANEDQINKLDIETQFLLRLLDSFKVDNPTTDKKKSVPEYKMLCEAHQKQFLSDVLKLLVYKDYVPRRELLNYIITILNFHTALFTLKNFYLINNLVDNGNLRCGSCKSIKGEKDFDKIGNCEFQPKIFVDLTLGQDKICDLISKNSVDSHLNEMFRYFKSHYKLVKVNAFASTSGIKDPSMEQLVTLMISPAVEPFFQVKLSEFTGDEDLNNDPDVQEILRMKIPSLDKYVEIICTDKSNWKNRVRNHKQLLYTLCNRNREDGFLQGGRGKQRNKFVLGNHLLELLVQLAVVSADPKGFKTKPITIVSFVDWLKNRYGIYINEWITDSDSPETSKALNNNFLALKDRLRQLGFYTDLSDASNSQVIKPRFKIEPTLK